MFYTNNDVKNVFTQLIVNIVLALLILIGGIVAGFVIALNGSETLGTIVLCIVMFAFIFMLGNFVLPCFYYYRYLLDIMVGRYNRRTGTVKKIGKKPVYKDNKNYYYEIDIDIGGGMYGLFLYDANLGKPKMKENEYIDFVCYEHFIIEIAE